MVLFFEVPFNIINSIILAKFYTAFLTPKNKNISANLSVIGFGIAYLLSQFALGQLPSTFSVFPLTLTKIIISASIIFILTCVFFKKDTGVQIFLLCGFLAVQDIGVHIATSISRLFVALGGLLFNALWDNSVMNTVEEATAYYDILTVINIIVNLSVYAAVSILSLYHITKSFTYKKYSLCRSELLSLILPCLSGLSITHIIKTILLQPDSSVILAFIGIPFIDALTFIAGVFLLLTIIASVRLFQKTIEQHMEEKNTAVLQKQFRQIRDQDIDGVYAEIRGMRHDMKSHMTNIQLLVKAVVEGREGVTGGLKEYFEKMEDTLNRFDFAYQTGNPVLDIVIHQKSLEAKNRGIRFSADFLYPARLNIDAYDLAVILGNALENAIEACEAMPESDRYIILKSYTKGEMFFIDTENSFLSEFTLDTHTGLPNSNKPDKTAHGIGMSNIRRCAGKYLGDLDFEVSEARNIKLFRLTVMLQGRV